jgi:hypothetical protein
MVNISFLCAWCALHSHIGRAVLPDIGHSLPPDTRRAVLPDTGHDVLTDKRRAVLPDLGCAVLLDIGRCAT